MLTYRRTDIAKLIVTFRSFVEAPKNDSYMFGDTFNWINHKVLERWVN